MRINKIFCDANILLDLIDNDRGNRDKTKELIHRALIKDIMLYTSCDILSNIYYVARRKIEKELLVQEMLKIVEIFEIIAIDKELAQNALLKNLDFPLLDFEDLLQSECAMVQDCDLIVTNDKGFLESNIDHINIDEALRVI